MRRVPVPGRAAQGPGCPLSVEGDSVHCVHSRSSGDTVDVSNLEVGERPHLSYFRGPRPDPHEVLGLCRPCPVGGEAERGHLGAWRPPPLPTRARHLTALSGQPSWGPTHGGPASVQRPLSQEVRKTPRRLQRSCAPAAEGGRLSQPGDAAPSAVRQWGRRSRPGGSCFM